MMKWGREVDWAGLARHGEPGPPFDDGAGEVVAEVLVVVTEISHDIYFDELDVKLNNGNMYCQKPYRRQGIARF